MSYFSLQTVMFAVIVGIAYGLKLWLGLDPVLVIASAGLWGSLSAAFRD